MIEKHQLLNAMQHHIGKANGISVSQLVFEITGKPPTACIERQIRRQVKQLRLLGEHICAHPRTGYFIAENSAELDDTCEYLLGRSMSGLAQVAAMKRVSMPDLHGQLKLKN